MKWFYANLKINETISVTNPLRFTITYLNHLKKKMLEFMENQTSSFGFHFVLFYGKKSKEKSLWY